jgi:hypothetical protein
MKNAKILEPELVNRGSPLPDLPDTPLYRRLVTLTDRADQATGADRGYWLRWFVAELEETGFLPELLADQIAHIERTLADVEQRKRLELH